MKCPKCNSERATKNGRRRGKQCYKCRDCGRQFVESPMKQSYSPEVRQLCLKMYLNGMGLRGIERVTEIHQTTVMNWIKEAGIKLSDAPEGVEGENTRLRHYLARLHRKTLCYSKSLSMLKYLIRLLLHYLKFQTIAAIA